MLLTKPGEIVLREEMRTRLWPNDTIVEFDHSINAAIKRLRDTLGESAEEPRYVETVARRGYRFIGQVEGEHVHPAEQRAEPGAGLPAEGVDAVVGGGSATLSAPIPANRTNRRIVGTALLLLILAATVTLSRLRRPDGNQPTAYTQITSFTDSAVTPALSPDGRMVAFFRSERSWLSADPVYVTLLPNGTP